MKTLLLIALTIVSVLPSLQARDLHLIDGRIFRGVQSPKIIAGELRIVHDAGIASVSPNALSKADYYEFGLHINQPNSPSVLASSSTTTPGALGFNSATAGTGSSYSERSYSTRSYASRGYAPDYTPAANPPTVPASAPSYTSSTRYTRPPDNTPKTVQVRGYYTKKGTYVQPYSRRRAK
ncbi:MAG: hypothetical protein ABL962_12510 [Fimbriimonadaceae bacterium]